MSEPKTSPSINGNQSMSGVWQMSIDEPHRNDWQHYLIMVRELAIADFRLKYHDSVLGYLWSMLNPLLMFAVYYFVFTKIFTSTIPDYPLFLLSGIISYAFFQDTTFSAMSSFSAKAGIMKKIYFPRSVIVVAATLTCTFSFAINLSVLIALILFFEGIKPMMLLIPVPVICLMLFSAGIGFVLAVIYAHFRDMGQIWGVLVLALFWFSPIVFNVETLPKPISGVVYFNPLTRIFVLIRHYLLYNYFDMRFMVMTLIYSLISFLAGYLLFRHHQEQLPELF